MLYVAPPARVDASGKELQEGRAFWQEEAFVPHTGPVALLTMVNF